MKNVFWLIIFAVMVFSCRFDSTLTIKKVNLQNWGLRSSDNLFFINNNVLFTAYNLDNLNTGFLKIDLDVHTRDKEFEIINIIEAPLLSIDNSFDGVLIDIGIKGSKQFPKKQLLYNSQNGCLKKIESDLIFSTDSNYYILENKIGSIIYNKQKSIQLEYSFFNLIGGTADYTDYQIDVLTLFDIDKDTIVIYKLNLDTLILKEEQYLFKKELLIKQAIYSNNIVYLLTYDKIVYAYSLTNSSLKEISNNHTDNFSSNIELIDDYIIISEYQEGYTNVKVLELSTGKKLIEMPASDYYITDKEIIIVNKNEFSVFDSSGIIKYKKEINIKNVISDLFYYSEDLIVFKSNADLYIAYSSN